MPAVRSLLSLVHEGLPLPDEESGPVRFADGALDGITSHHGARLGDEKEQGGATWSL